MGNTTVQVEAGKGLISSANSVDALWERVQERYRDIADVERILTTPERLSSFVAVPDIDQIQLESAIPAGTFELLVRNGRAMVTQRVWLGGEMVASP